MALAGRGGRDGARVLQRSVSRAHAPDTLAHAQGPSYVCTSFGTFVCTTCSGIHRNFDHKVKGMSASKFSPAEVSPSRATQCHLRARSG